ncbi:ABC transporter ATP-binding protein [Saccharothrix sp. ST-888]|uniref:ABC transporter ATP-binding protein n=1 Tax=Saccharothrix sp. ST-888 TaxID=1427391 RepID=UPI0005ECDF93|nr:ABC transporter ATP-binding protein [Saccharothrix sp. ST-888]KJK59029.1 ABC transporter [Saccharothrix sp. ST-888]
MQNEPAVAVTGLVKRYGDKTAVDGLDLTVPRGAITAVLGPNGAGKTTTIETCEGYRRPDAGAVRVLGLDPIADARQLRPRVGVMLQAGGVYAGARAVEMLRHTARLHADPLDVDALVERLGLGSCGRTSYRRLSGGQQQRLALAMAVVGRPELVFLDEPTAGLDPQARRATWDLVRELKRDGVTVIVTTHHMDEAEELADQVAVVDRGRVIATGSPAELRGPEGESSLRFEAPAGLDLAALRKLLPEGVAADEISPGRYRVEAKLGPEVLSAITEWCALAGAAPERLTVQLRSLEDVFLDLTGRDLRS